MPKMRTYSSRLSEASTNYWMAVASVTSRNSCVTYVRECDRGEVGDDENIVDIERPRPRMKFEGRPRLLHHEWAGINERDAGESRC